jgi:hypothetical protein
MFNKIPDWFIWKWSSSDWFIWKWSSSGDFFSSASTHQTLFLRPNTTLGGGSTTMQGASTEEGVVLKVVGIPWALLDVQHTHHVLWGHR